LIVLFLIAKRKTKLLSFSQNGMKWRQNVQLHVIYRYLVTRKSGEVNKRSIRSGCPYYSYCFYGSNSSL